MDVGADDDDAVIVVVIVIVDVVNGDVEGDNDVDDVKVGRK